MGIKRILLIILAKGRRRRRDATVYLHYYQHMSHAISAYLQLAANLEAPLRLCNFRSYPLFWCPSLVDSFTSVSWQPSTLAWSSFNLLLTRESNRFGLPLERAYILERVPHNNQLPDYLPRILLVRGFSTIVQGHRDLGAGC